MDLLSAMHENGRSGELRGTAEQLARVARCGASELEAALTELQLHGAAHIEHRNQAYIVRNRRMHREAIARKCNADKQKRHRDQRRNHDVTNKSPPSSSSSSSPSGEPRQDPLPPTTLTGDRSHPAQRFNDRDPRYDAIVKAYPNRTGRARGIAAAQEAAARLRTGSDDLGEHPPPADAVAWLYARVLSFAKSPLAKQDGGKYVPNLARWMDERRYADPPGAWGESKVVSGGESPRAVYERLTPEQQAECMAAGHPMTPRGDGWWARVYGFAAKTYGQACVNGSAANV